MLSSLESYVLPLTPSYNKELKREESEVHPDMGDRVFEMNGYDFGVPGVGVVGGAGGIGGFGVALRG